MQNPKASLIDIRLDSATINSNMNKGAAELNDGTLSITCSAKSHYNVGGIGDEKSCVLGRVNIESTGTVKGVELFKIVVGFVGRYEYDCDISSDEIRELIKNEEYCGVLGLQMQSIVNMKFAEIVRFVGIDTRLPLGLIKLHKN